MLSLPKDDLKKQEILSEIAEKFQEGRTYSEEEVNNIMKDCRANDHALFRRELVDFNYLGKDSYKGIYWLKKRRLSEEENKKIAKNQERIDKAKI